MKLADKLDSIALGESYYESSLYDALEHPVTTRNDRDMLIRYLYGSNTLNDRYKLQDLAIKMRMYDIGE